MRKLLFLSLIAVIAVSCLVFSSRAENVSLRGDYVEVRTASVFAGACHYNGEVTTTGRDAMMAWSVSSGKWQGVDLAGVRAVAVVSSAANLAENDVAKQSEILIDNSVSRTQALAFLHALEEKYAAALGKVVAVRYTPVTFDHKDKSFNVVAGEATINVEAMPNDLCCKMPNLVWYKPMVSLENRKVGYTLNATYSGKSVGEPWGRSGENSAFYGIFSL